MALSSVVAVTDTDIDAGSQLEFTPGGTFPAAGLLRLTITHQLFPTQSPTYVVPAITSVMLGYGRLAAGVQPASVIPEDHALRMLSFSADYRHGSWHVSGTQAELLLDITATLRDNSPGGDAAPDDPFVATVYARAICIWTSSSGRIIRRLLGR